MYMWLKVGTKQFEEAKIADGTAVEYYRTGFKGKLIGPIHLGDYRRFVPNFDYSDFIILHDGDYIKVIDLKEGLPIDECCCKTYTSSDIEDLAKTWNTRTPDKEAAWEAYEYVSKLWRTENKVKWERRVVRQLFENYWRTKNPDKQSNHGSEE